MCLKSLFNQPGLCITGLGLMTSVGHDAKTACASIRAGLKRPVKLENFYLNSKEGHEEWEDGLVTGHPVLEGSPDDTEPRLFSLITRALQDLYKDAAMNKEMAAGTPLYAAFPETYREKTDHKRLQAHLSDNPEDIQSAFKEVIAFYQGHAAMIAALANAAEAIAEKKCERAIIAGADSLIGYDDLCLFNNAGRLKTIFNSDGFIPGEAGAAVLVEKTDAAKSRNAEIGAVIEGISVDHEADNVLSGKNATGNILVKVISEMASQAPIVPDTIITDMNGETYRADELGNIHSRVLGRMEGEKNMSYPAKCLGDTGAAYAGIAFAIAVRAMARGYIADNKKQGNALILASSDSGARGAVYMKPAK